MLGLCVHIYTKSQSISKLFVAGKSCHQDVALNIAICTLILYSRTSYKRQRCQDSEWNSINVYESIKHSSDTIRIDFCLSHYLYLFRHKRVQRSHHFVINFALTVNCKKALRYDKKINVYLLIIGLQKGGSRDLAVLLLSK